MYLHCTRIILLLVLLPAIKFASADSKCIGPVCTPDSYDKTILPFQNKTNHIDVGFQYIKILKVDDEESTITLSLQLFFIWMDPRLKVEIPSEDISFTNFTSTTLNSGIMDIIWIPSPDILDLKSIKQKNRWLSLFTQHNDGYLSVTLDLEIVVYCSMVFDHYPLDSHICYFKMISLDHTDDKLSFKNRSMIPIEHVVQKLQLHYKTLNILDYHVEFGNLPKKHGIIEYGTLNRTVLGFAIKLERKYKKYFIYYYIPSGLIAITACVSLYSLGVQVRIMKLIFNISAVFKRCSWKIFLHIIIQATK